MDKQLIDLLIRFGVNIVVVLIIIYGFYYPKSKRRDYSFTFTLISISIFFLIYMLGEVKLKIGFALGLFAIFGIIRYRTETIPVREMTYLFMIIALSVINALNEDWGVAIIAVVNLIFIICIWICEGNRLLKHIACKYVKYDRIELIVPERYEELLADLKKRTGLEITKVDVGSIDFLKDSAILKVYYKPLNPKVTNPVDTVMKIPDEEY
ncbi:MAG: DUF4956 domain-containing protein [Prevotella sp.]|nr:DUF4956 domain-containing protein [Prevotella sp.]